MVIKLNDILNKQVQYLKGVGPKRALLLQRINIFTVGDLLYHFPRDYQDRSNIKPAHSFEHGETATVIGRVLYAQELKPRRGLTVIKLSIDDGAKVFQAIWFNQKYIIKQYPPGTLLLLTGRIDKSFRNSVQLQVVDSEKIDDPDKAKQESHIIPVYALTEGVTQNVMRAMMQRALHNVGELSEFMPVNLLTKYKLPSLNQALQDIHHPQDKNAIVQAKRRFIFEELFLLQLMLAKRRQKNQRLEKYHRYQPGEGPLVQQLLAKLPFKPTTDQIKVWTEIYHDLDSPYPMNRLLQGDVGSGKTLISALMLVKAVESGLQGALMAPTEILAEQHYIGLTQWLQPLGIKVGLLTSSIKKSQRETLLAQCESGQLQVLIGTHALIQEVVNFKKLGAVVVDEQHRFGVKQRMALQAKGNLPDVLVMTATPIPRTMALTVYGDLEMSVIYQLPPGRKPIRTHFVNHKRIRDVYSLIKREVSQGRQAYIVCPLVEESEALDVQSAVDLAAELSQSTFKEMRIGLLHGRMRAEEKEMVMHDFRAGEIDVLVSTTVIEVGVDVSNATVMVILDADRFGLAQLHQLRGRVGRGKHQSHCILVANPKTDEGKKRMAAMVNSNDGFALAEEDLRLRGPGEFLGFKQSGVPEFKIANLIRDRQAMEYARHEASLLVQKDSGFKADEHHLLVKELQRRFGNKEELLNIG
ncbi:ATP-dependent DNA helicase RecG [Peptococcaceae bacterium 1198_IL3148]